MSRQYPGDGQCGDCDMILPEGRTYFCPKCDPEGDIPSAAERTGDYIAELRSALNGCAANMRDLAAERDAAVARADEFELMNARTVRDWAALDDENARLRAVLTELVACKDLKDSLAVEANWPNLDRGGQSVSTETTTRVGR